jgi:hypothetical protein
VSPHPLKGSRSRSRATLADTLRGLLDDGTGRTHPALDGLLHHLVEMPEPDRGNCWIHNNPHVATTLRGLASGDIALTHQALHALPSWRTTAHLRDLLMATGALPVIDRQIPMFEQWALARLADVANPDHARLLHQFLRWQQLPALHATAHQHPLSAGHRNSATGAWNNAHRFLLWLANHDQQLADTTQANLDLFHVEHPHPELRRFLTWAIGAQHMPRLKVPTIASTGRNPISQPDRLELIRRTLTDTTIELRTRVAALLLLLFAQPVSTLLRLTIDDVIHHDDGQLALRLGHPATPVPEPFAELLRQHLTARTNMNTAANPASRWLFPGGRTGQPLTAGTLGHQLQALGIPTRRSRTAALRELTLQAPAPIVADALGYGTDTALRHHHAAAGAWNRYPGIRP